MTMAVDFHPCASSPKSQTDMAERLPQEDNFAGFQRHQMEMEYSRVKCRFGLTHNIAIIHKSLLHMVQN